MKITTLSIAPAKIRVETSATADEVNVEILDGEAVVARGAGAGCEIRIPGAKL